MKDLIKIKYMNIIVECLVCGKTKITDEDYFNGMAYCEQCDELTSHMFNSEIEE